MMACDSADITLPSRASPAIWRFHPHVARRVAEQMRRLGEQSPLLSLNMRRWKWIPFSPESLFPPLSLTLNNSLTCQSCFTRRRQGWIFEAKAGDEQSPPVYRPRGLYWAADGTRRPSAYCTYLSSLNRTSEPTLPPARINVNGLPRRRHGGGRESGCDALSC